MSNKKQLRAQRHLSQPMTSNKTAENTLSIGENIEVSSDGLVKTINYNGKKYVTKLTEE